MSHDHRLCKGKSNASAEISPPDDPPVGSLVSTASNSSTNSAFSTALPPTPPSIHHSRGPLLQLSLKRVPVHASSQPPSHSSSSSSSTVVQGSLDVSHDSASILLFNCRGWNSGIHIHILLKILSIPLVFVLFRSIGHFVINFIKLMISVRIFVGI